MNEKKRRTRVILSNLTRNSPQIFRSKMELWILQMISNFWDLERSLIRLLAVKKVMNWVKQLIFTQLLIRIINKCSTAHLTTVMINTNLKLPNKIFILYFQIAVIKEVIYNFLVRLFKLWKTEVNFRIQLLGNSNLLRCCNTKQKSPETHLPILSLGKMRQLKWIDLRLKNLIWIREIKSKIYLIIRVSLLFIKRELLQLPRGYPFQIREVMSKIIVLWLS